MHSFYQPSGLDTPDIKRKNQTHETAKANTSTETSQTVTSGATTAQEREGGKKCKSASHQHQKNDLEGSLLQAGGGEGLLGEGGGLSPPVEDGSSAPALENEQQMPE